MVMQRVAVLSMHTSPLAQAGVGDGGGMNVYVRELVSSLANLGVECTTYTRRWRDDLPREVQIEPNHRVVHVPAGPLDLPKEGLIGVVDEFTDNVARHITKAGGTDVVHANYWLSGLAGHRLKHELNLPLVTTFHTFARVKSAGGDHESVEREAAKRGPSTCAGTRGIAGVKPVGSSAKRQHTRRARRCRTPGRTSLPLDHPGGPPPDSGAGHLPGGPRGTNLCAGSACAA